MDTASILGGLRHMVTARLGALLVALILATGAIAACEPDDTGLAPGNGETPANGDAATPDAAGEPSEGERVPLEILEGPDGQVIVVVPVFIAGEGPFAFALDTGASRTLVDQAIADQLELPISEQGVDVLGVGGQSQVDLVEVQTWRLGERVALPPSTLAVIDLPAAEEGSGLQGLMGSDQLAEFGTVFIDFDEGFMVVGAELAD
jgi:hypothetical protein